MNIQEVRAKFPDYNDLSDQQLADALHQKFYADLPKDQFYAKIGLGGDKPEVSYGGMVAEAAGRGLQNLAGLPRAIGDLATATDQRAANKGVAPLIPNPMRALGYLPKGADIVQTANAPENQPQTTGQKLLAGGIEAATGALPFGPAALLPAAAGGAAQEGAKEYGLGPVGQLITGVATSIGAGGLQNQALKLGRAATGKSVENPTIAAMKEEGVDPNLAGTIAGGTPLKMFERSLQQSTGAGVIKEASDKAIKQIDVAVERAASKVGSSTRPEQAGRTIQTGIQGFVDEFKTKHRDLLNKVNISENARVPISNTEQFYQNIRSRFGSDDAVAEALKNPKLTGLLESALKDAQQGGLRWGTIKAIRTEVGDLMATPGLVADVPRGQLKQLYGALTEDLKSAATTMGADTLAAFNRANRYYSSGIARIEGSLNRLSDARIPEQAYQLATQGKASDLYALRRSLKPEEWGEVSGTVLRNLGRKAEGGDFDIQAFLRNWNGLGEQAKAALFRGNGFQDYSRSIDNISKIAKTFGESATVRNTSNTSGNTYFLSLLSGAGGASIGAMTGEPGTGATIGALAGTVLAPLTAAKLMTSPAFVKWLATPVGKNQVPARISALTQVVRQQPAIAEEVKQFIEAAQAGSQ